MDYLKLMTGFLVAITVNVDYAFGQQEEDHFVMLAQYSELTLIQKIPECRLRFKDDSTLIKAATYDYIRDAKLPVRTYFRIGNAAGIAIVESQKIALSRYKIRLIYTHCVYCRYQALYNQLFEEDFNSRHKSSLSDVINKIEETASKRRSRRR